VMYNLEVAQDHTFTVGDGQWVVHNCTGKNTVYRVLRENEDTTNGIVVKDPTATEYSIYDHVRFGSQGWFKGPYISTTRSINFARAWATGGGANKLVAVVDLDQVTSPVIDLSTEEAQQAIGFNRQPDLARLSLMSQEVLVQGRIDPAAILEYILGSEL